MPARVNWGVQDKHFWREIWPAQEVGVEMWGTRVER